MGIDASDLERFSPWAQKQITEKLLAQEREKAKRKDSSTALRSAQNDTGNGRKHAGEYGEKENKYRNIPDTRNGADGKIIKFKSKKEARRYDELMLMLKAGKIRELKLQPQFTLQEAYTTPEGNRVHAIRYDADFSYYILTTELYVVDGGGSTQAEEEWQYVVEDVKSKATKTRVYAIKKKLMRERFGIEIQEVE